MKEDVKNDDEVSDNVMEEVDTVEDVELKEPKIEIVDKVEEVVENGFEVVENGNDVIANGVIY